MITFANLRIAFISSSSFLPSAAGWCLLCYGTGQCRLQAGPCCMTVTCPHLGCPGLGPMVVTTRGGLSRLEMISIQTMLVTRVMLPGHVATCPSRPGAAKHCVRGEAWILTSTSATVTHFPGPCHRPDCQHSRHSDNNTC